jgi:hypothetical protein
MLSGMDRDRLEALRRQVEDDYRLDIAAIERLQRRYLDVSNIISGNPIPSSIIPAPSAPSGFDPSPSAGPSNEWRPEQHPAALSPSGPAKPQDDELVGSIRSMFSASRR